MYDRIKLFGRVQGVFFRDSARRKGRSLGLSGYASNLRDGSLEIVAAGDTRKIQALFEWAKRGPIFARVERYEIDKVKIAEPLEGFKIKYD